MYRGTVHHLHGESTHHATTALTSLQLLFAIDQDQGTWDFLLVASTIPPHRGGGAKDCQWLALRGARKSGRRAIQQVRTPGDSSNIRFIELR